MRKQIALCIGQNEYRSKDIKPLNGSANDARQIGEKLKKLNYDVTILENLSRNDFHKAIDNFAKQLPNYDVCLFFYAGHGFEYKGKNLLIPIDIDANESLLVEKNSVELQYIIDELNGATYQNNLKFKIVILDACRNDYTTRGNYNKGFAPICAPKGMIIAFSTSPGQGAKEDKNGGYYTQSLLKHIDLKRIPIENMFKHVRESLSAATNESQISWEHTSLMGDYYFNEDSIQNFIEYSDDALKDSVYKPVDSLTKEIIDDLKSHDWNIQNPSMNKISKIDFNKASANDLFVLGRNICQAASAAYNVRNFINNFSNYGYIPNSAKQHILNGMVYEIYFDSSNKIRKHFKTICYPEIISLLQRKENQLSKNFIINKLLKENDRFVFIPVSEHRITFDIVCGKSIKYNEKEFFPIIQIFYKGKNIMLNENKESVSTSDCDRPIIGLSSIINELAEYIAAPNDMVEINFVDKSARDSNYLIPFNYILIK